MMRLFRRGGRPEQWRAADFTPRYLPIAWKIVAVIAGLTLTGIGVLAWVILSQVSTVLNNQIQAQAELTVAPVARTSGELILAEDHLTLETLLNSLVEDGRVEYIAAYAIDRGRVAAAGSPPADDAADGVWPLTAGAEPYRREVRFQDVQVGYIEARIDSAPMQELMRNTVNAGVITAAIVFLLSLILAIDISKRLVRPLERLAESMRERMQPGPDDQDDPRVVLRRDEITQLTEAFNTMAHDLLRKDQVEAALRRYVSTGVAEDILDNLDRVELGGRAVEGSVLFADITGYTALSQQCTPEALGRMLNEFFGPMTECIAEHGGTVDKYMGDCTMAVFGAARPDPDHRITALRTGLALLDTIAGINAEREARGERRVEFRIGLYAGEMLAGNMGARERMQFTVVGETVNLAARLVTIAPPGGLVTTRDFMEHPHMSQHNTGKLVQEDLGQHALHGLSEPVDVVRVHPSRTTA
ncbi:MULTISPECIES: adenylate/guanylate cyclase domain-containing protein [unclassified Thioalkalivibrio]|uniref:adenylate/guanylate cyclase domain-containing protein n=1 Tax=unclassified Thioalkalivibrio TaxID=2621013 RepID=UPI00036D40B8|nr:MULTISPECIES: adenylate/guanylate cyclase domain-containing protein [unclassified Thioalkalivibrio]PYG01476.1 adenylate cyclase [Thioalkalivibrio sp. ALE21]